MTNNYAMEHGNTKINLDKLGWPTLEERRLQTKLTTLQKARLDMIDIPTDHLAIKTRQTRLGGDGPTYQRLFSDIDGHIYSFYPHTTLVWNLLPLNVRMCEDINTFNREINNINLITLKNKIFNR